MGARMGQITVGVFDEHTIFSHGIAAVLADDPAVMAVTIDPLAAPAVDVAVTSLKMLRELDLACPVVVCVPERELAALGGLERGASALLERESVTPEQLCGAVHAAAAGLRIEAASGGAVELLDVRTRAILRMLAEGAGTREISQRLGYSERTIKGAIHQAQISLGARSRAQAVALALRTSAI
jgi:DNA-binding NarL/FixJ family response regulator